MLRMCLRELEMTAVSSVFDPLPVTCLILCIITETLSDELLYIVKLRWYRRSPSLQLMLAANHEHGAR